MFSHQTCLSFDDMIAQNAHNLEVSLQRDILADIVDLEYEDIEAFYGEQSADHSD